MRGSSRCDLFTAKDQMMSQMKIIFAILVWSLLVAAFNVWEKHAIKYNNPVIPPRNVTDSIFIHAVCGIFNRKRGNDTWGYGLDILNELLTTIGRSHVVDYVANVHISLIGRPSDVLEAKLTLEALNSTTTTRLFGKIRVVVEGHDMNLAEFPTLYALQLYADRYGIEGIC